MTTDLPRAAETVCETFAFGDTTISLETGRIARQADASVVLRERRSVLLATVVTEPMHHITRDPYLTVEYRERTAAVGRIPGNYFRRELRPGEHEILLNRTIDRSLRPLLPEFYDRSIQLQIMVFSADPASDIASLAMLAASAVMTLAPVPMAYPVAGARFIRSQGQLMSMSRADHRKGRDLELFVTASPKGFVTVEGETHRLPVDALCEALAFAQDALKPVLEALARLQQAAGVSPAVWQPQPLDPVLEQEVQARVSDVIAAMSELSRRRARNDLVAEARRRAVEALCGTSEEGPTAGPVEDLVEDTEEEESEPAPTEEEDTPHAERVSSSWEPQQVRTVFDALFKRAMRAQILAGRRLDGRSAEQLRPVVAEVGFMPMSHGSALFTRGETQALISATLGRLGEGQSSERLHGQKTSNFLVHYNFPGYATGHIVRFRPPGFREYGHGNLARRAFLPLLPNLRDLGKTIRVVSDITESAGSSSMATVCGASLAMMEAGVPLAEHVAGVAVGLIQEPENLLILSDITEEEDACGDMDLKLAGTPTGITTLQLDSKHEPVSLAVLKQAFERSWTNLQELLKLMYETIPPTGPIQDTRSTNKASEKEAAQTPASEPEPAKLALLYQIDAAMVGRVIGTKGRNVRAIEQALPVKMKASNDGIVTLTGDDLTALQKARNQVKALLLTLQKQHNFLAVVTDISEHGAMARIGDHQGWISAERLAEQPDIQVGSEILVTPIGSDTKGQLLLDHKSVAELDVTTAANYVADSEEFQNRTEVGSNA